MALQVLLRAVLLQQGDWRTAQQQQQCWFSLLLKGPGY
jgi:hypothetical protein